MAVKEGYKQTDVGVIPEDWDVKSIGDIANVKAGGTPSTLIKTYWDGSIRWMSSGELNYKRIFDVVGRITELGLKNSSASIIPINSVLIGLAGQGKTRGTVAMNYVELCTNQSVAAIFPNENSSQEYIYQCLDSKYEEIRSLSYGEGGRGGLNLKIIKGINIPFPPLPEQKAIATALSDIDGLINSLTKLIEKMKNIKQGAMQELLSGKKRLEGFSGEWERKKIKEIVQIPVSDGPHLTPKFIDDGVPFLSVNNLVNNKISFNGIRYISMQDHIEFSKKCKPQKGDILLGKAASVGIVAIANLNSEFNVWSPIAVIRLKEKYDAKFFLYSFQTKKIINDIKLLTNSSSQGNLGMGDIEKIEFLIPTKDEQSAIATILSDMDSEIEALQTKLNKYKAIKQGMMQELLTGRIRLLEGA